MRNSLGKPEAWEMAKEVTIEVRGLIGTASPFRQGGSIRIVLPKKIARAYNTQRPSSSELEDVTFFFIATNIGILMCSLLDLSRNPIMRELILSQQTRP